MRWLPDKVRELTIVDFKDIVEGIEALDKN